MDTVHGLAPILRATSHACSAAIPVTGTCIAVFDQHSKTLLSVFRSGEHAPEISTYNELAGHPLFEAVTTNASLISKSGTEGIAAVTAPIRIKGTPSGTVTAFIDENNGIAAGDALGIIDALASQCGSTIGELNTLRVRGREDIILENLFENAPEAVVLLDANNRVMRINGEFTRLFGYDIEEIRGEHIDSLIAPGDLYTEASGYSHRAEIGEKLSAETVRVRKDGSAVEVSMLGAPIVIEGQIAGIFGIYRDISDRKHMERELGRSESRYRQIFENAPIGIFQTHSRGYFLKLNHAAARIFGYDSVDDFLSHVTDLAADIYEEPSQRGDFLARMRAQGEVKNFTIKAKCKDGSLVTISINARISAYEGDEFVIDGFILDLTELKKTEHHLSKSLKEKEVLLQELHHRVKNNMQIISSLLTMEADTLEPENQTASRVLRISQNRIRSMSLIHEKLYNSGDLTRIDLGEYTQELCHEVFELSLTQPLPEVEFEVASIAANIDFAIPFGLILNELLLNATKHAFSGIQTPRIRITLQHAKENLKLTVSDNGAGLPDDFEQQRGRNLGLQLIDSLVEQLSGTLTFSSHAGTSCILELPYPPDPAD